MPDYDLYYWPVPFRGEFVRAVLAFAGMRWREHDAAAISKWMSGPPKRMPVPFMGPPVLVDVRAKVAISQTTAIVLYLGETLRLLPADAAERALALKTVADANDVIDEVTLDGGRQMWTAKSWRAFEPRLEKWMSLWEESGRRHGLKRDSGFLLGGDAPGIADVVTAILWGTPAARFPRIAEMLEKAAPRTAALGRRIGALPALAKLAAKSRRAYGEAYCGGQIEASLRKALGGA